MNLENRMDITLFDIYADLHVHVCEQKRGQDMLIFLENAEDFFFFGLVRQRKETKQNIPPPPCNINKNKNKRGGGRKVSLNTPTVYVTKEEVL